MQLDKATSRRGMEHLWCQVSKKIAKGNKKNVNVNWNHQPKVLNISCQSFDLSWPFFYIWKIQGSNLAIFEGFLDDDLAVEVLVSCRSPSWLRLNPWRAMDFLWRQGCRCFGGLKIRGNYLKRKGFLTRFQKEPQSSILCILLTVKGC